MTTQTNKIKQHFKDHKEAYIAGGVGLATGVVIGVLFRQTGNQASMTRILSPGANHLIQITIPKPGNSGNMIYCKMLNTYFPSQNAAAKALGENKGEISKLLNAKRPDINGYGLKKIAENGIVIAT